MSKIHIESINRPLPEIRKRIILNLAINGLLPAIVYVLLHSLQVADVVTLAIAGAIPAARSLVLWLWRRRVDWLGLLSVLGFAFALAASAFSHGSTWLLKVHEQLLFGTLGLVFLSSALIQRPLLQPLLVALTGRDPANGDQPARAGRITWFTVAIGLVLLGDAVIHVILAAILSTAAYLAASHLVTWVILGCGLAILWLTRRSAAGSVGEHSGPYRRGPR